MMGSFLVFAESCSNSSLLQVVSRCHQLLPSVFQAPPAVAVLYIQTLGPPLVRFLQVMKSDVRRVRCGLSILFMFVVSSRLYFTLCFDQKMVVLLFSLLCLFLLLHQWVDSETKVVYRRVHVLITDMWLLLSDFKRLLVSVNRMKQDQSVQT